MKPCATSYWASSRDKRTAAAAILCTTVPYYSTSAKTSYEELNLSSKKYIMGAVIGLFYLTLQYLFYHFPNCVILYRLEFVLVIYFCSVCCLNYFGMILEITNRHLNFITIRIDFEINWETRLILITRSPHRLPFVPYSLNIIKNFAELFFSLVFVLKISRFFAGRCVKDRQMASYFILKVRLLNHTITRE